MRSFLRSRYTGLSGRSQKPETRQTLIARPYAALCGRRPSCRGHAAHGSHQYGPSFDLSLDSLLYDFAWKWIASVSAFTNRCRTHPKQVGNQVIFFGILFSNALVCEEGYARNAIHGHSSVIVIAVID